MTGKASRVVIVADDLTGAADAGVQFRRAGLPARVWLGVHAPGPGGATVYDTDTRSAAPRSAAAIITRIGAALEPDERAFKKIDSTMRGNVGAEVTALLHALGRRIAIVAPAFPANGRTTRGGVQFVDGVPAHRTAIGRDPAHPMRWSSIGEALSDQTDLTVEAISLATVRGGADRVVTALSEHAIAAKIVVVDAETDSDLRVLARAVAALGPACLPVGSAGLAAHLPAAWGLLAANGADVAPAARPVARACLFVCGSLNPRTREQVALLCPDPIDASLPDASARARTQMDTTGVAVLSSAGWLANVHAAEVGRALGRLVADIAAGTRPDALLLTGGDTARAALAAVDAHGIELDAELLPGLPIGRVVGGGLAGVRLITKAGGFGPPDALVKALSYLRGESTSGEEATR